MPYRFATERRDYSDYASGKVFYALPGYPAFPVRLASEIFQRCLEIRAAEGGTQPCVLYDPCCGGAYHLSTLAFLHWHAIGEIIGSDIDEQALSLAERNLALLTVRGLDKRVAEISDMLGLYGKPSHAAALQSAEFLRDRLHNWSKTHPIKTRLFCADATDGKAIGKTLKGEKVDVVFTDVPYGRHSAWQVSDVGASMIGSAVWLMLESLLPVLSAGAVVAVSSDKQQKIAHDGFQRVDHFRLGKRQIVLLRPVAFLGATS